jgi:hypothetical protein
MKNKPNYVNRIGHSNDYFNSTIVIMDEAHNIMEPPFQELYQRVYHAKNAVVMLFTATPVIEAPPGDEMADARELLDITKGIENENKSDEGFVSWFMQRSTELFAAHDLTKPDHLPKVIRVYIDETKKGMGYQSYLWSIYANARFGHSIPQTDLRKMEQMKKLTQRPAHQTDPVGKNWSKCIDIEDDLIPCPAELGNLEHVVFDSLLQAGMKVEPPIPMYTVAEMAPKMAKIAGSIHKNATLKTLVLIHEDNGVQALLHLLRYLKVSPLLVIQRPDPQSSKWKRCAFKTPGAP